MFQEGRTTEEDALSSVLDRDDVHVSIYRHEREVVVHVGLKGGDGVRGGFNVFLTPEEAERVGRSLLDAGD